MRARVQPCGCDVSLSLWKLCPVGQELHTAAVRAADIMYDTDPENTGPPAPHLLAAWNAAWLEVRRHVTPEGEPCN